MLNRKNLAKQIERFKAALMLRCPQCGCSGDIRTNVDGTRRCRRCGYRGPGKEFEKN